jgi:apolipoprotein N-acyltransferase
MSHPSPHLPLLAAGLSGLLTPLAFAPYRQFWLMPLLLAGLIWLTWHYASTVRQAFRLGYIWGFFAYLAQFYWIFHSLHDVGGMPSWMAVPVTMLFPAYLALYPALAMALTRQLGRQRPMVWLIALPTSWTLSEWLRATLFSGFPWGNVGYSQIPESPLSPLAPIVGIYGIAWVVCLTAAALALVWVLTKKAKNGLVFGIATLWLGSWGLMQAEVGWTSPQGSPFSVALVQGNIPQDLKWQPNQFRHTIDVYENLIGQQKASLVVLPETAIPSFLEQTPLSDLAVLVQAARKQDSELASGVAYQSPSGTQYYNGVVSLTSPKPPYGKNHLVPFGEF